MLIHFDPAKDRFNQAKHGVSLTAAGLIEWDTSLIREDARKDYGENRFQALGLLDGRLYPVAFTVRGEALRVISMRKANKREERQYEQA
jgi:uncharacterized DUF497 family protein